MNRFDSGFTLIELMIVLTIIIILMFIGIPSYQSLIAYNNIAAEANALTGDLQYARSNAIKNGLPVNVCTANTNGGPPYACSGSSTWSGGWVTYINNPPTNTVLRVQQPLTSTDAMTSNSATALSSVSFNYFGFATIKGSITVSPQSGSVSPKTVCISVVGNVQLVDGGDSLCP